MKAIILAAGLGTRLRPLTNNIPKPLVPVANYANILQIIEHLKKQGINRITINLHYKPQPLINLLGNGEQLNVHLEYSMEPEILGTGGGIKKMLSMGPPQTTVVINGDVLFMPDIKKIIRNHTASGAMATMVIRKSAKAEQLGAVGIDTRKMVKRLVYAGDQTLANIYMFTGMHIIEPDLAKMLPDNGCIVRKTYIPMVEQNSHKLFAQEDNSYFCDLGTPEDYLSSNLKIARGEIAVPLCSKPSGSNITGHGVAYGQGCVIENSVIGNNVKIKDKITIKNCVVLDNAAVTENISNAIVLEDGQIMKV